MPHADAMPAHEETLRQRALDAYHLVDSLPDPAYDDIARIAAMLCDAPTAFVSLVDRERQWFKARVGIESEGGARADAFCDHAIRAPDRVFEVQDAASDPRFAANPWVTGAQGVRFYAGMPLVTPAGAAVGTVCVADQVPRRLSPSQHDALASLARLTMNLMEAHRRERERAAVAAIAGPAVPTSDILTVLVLEVQGLGSLARRDGPRAVERLLGGLDAELAGRLPVGDSVTRVSGSGEFIIALHGHAPGCEQDLLDVASRFSSASGLEVISASAAATPGEHPTATYLRAEGILSDAKDRAMDRAS